MDSVFEYHLNHREIQLAAHEWLIGAYVVNP